MASFSAETSSQEVGGVIVFPARVEWARDLHEWSKQKQAVLRIVLFNGRVRLWYFADILNALTNVRFWAQSGL